jgi:hypothetical protein
MRARFSAGRLSSYFDVSPRMRSLARRNRLLVLSASTDAAFVNTAGAAMSESSAKGFCVRLTGAMGTSTG